MDSIRYPYFLERVTMEHRRERVPNDYGPPDSLHYKNYVPMTVEEESAYYDEILELNLPK